MQGSSITVPTFIREHLGEDCLHVFLIHNPVAMIVSMMIAEAYHIPSNEVCAISIRQANTKIAGFVTLSPESRRYDRYVNRLTGLHLAAFRLRRTLERQTKRYILYTSWVYPEAETLLSSTQCVGHVILEEGQMSYYQAKPYTGHFTNRWLFRRKKVLHGSIDHYFRDDAACCVGLTAEAFPCFPQEKRYTLTNFADITSRYTPRLQGILSIGLMPAPRRLPPTAVLPAIDMLIGAMQGKGVIKMHPGFLMEKSYFPQEVAGYIRRVSNGRVALCPDDVLVELEMLAEKKQLYGARTSLSRYAKLFGSTFHAVVFNHYIHPII